MNKNLKYILILGVLSYFFFIFGNSIIDLTVPDEVFYTQTAKEMLQQNTWTTPYLFGAPQFEKPIFLYWLMRIGFIFFGITNFSARFFPALFASLGVIATYLLCVLGFRNQRKAFICSLLLLSGGLYIGLARTVFTDMIFSVFILFALLAFFWGYVCPKRKGPGILLFFVFSACAVLSKGPLGILIPAIVVIAFLTTQNNLKFFASKYSFWGVVLFALFSVPWYALMIHKYGSVFINEFFINDHLRRLMEAEHLVADTWYFYPVTMVTAMFPWSLYVLVSLFFLFKDARKKIDPIYPFLICWIVATFLIFQPAHSKLASYIFPMFPALAIVAGDFIFDAALLKKRERPLLIISIITFVVLIFFIVSLFVGLIAFPAYILKYLSSGLPVYIMIFLVSLLAGSFFICVKRRDFLRSVYALMFFLPAIFCVVPVIAKDIEPYVSPKDACEYLLKNYKVDGLLLSSKFFVRGIRYYTDKDVAAMNPHGKNFFSPHPIPFLDTDEKVAEILRKQPVTYCIFKKSSLEDIQRQEKDFKIELLKVIGNVYLVKVEPRTKR